MNVPATEQPTPTSARASRIARRFATDLLASKRPSIEAALDAAPRDEWGALLHTLLVAEVDARRARGETPLAREYLPRFPAHTDVVRAVLPEASAPTVGFEATSMGTFVAPLPLPLKRPVRGPLPQAIVLGSPDEEAARSKSRDPRRRRWWAIALVLFVLSVAVLLSRSPRAGNESGPMPADDPPRVNSHGKVVPKWNRKAMPADPERDLAEWVTAVGGRGTMLLANGGRRTFGEEVPLPKGKFAVTGLSLPGEAAVLWSEADLDRLRGRTSLASVRLDHPAAISDSALEPLTGLPLATLELHGLVRVSGQTLARFPDLESLALMSAPAFADADLAIVAKMSKLRSLALNTYHLTPEGFAGLKNPELRSITFGNHVRLKPDHVRYLLALPLEEFESHAGMTDDAFLEFATLPHLKRIRLHETALTDAGLKAVLGLGHLEELRVVGSSIAGPGLEHLEERTSLRVLDLSGGKVQDKGMEYLVTLPALREVRLASCPISDQGVTVLSQIDGLQTLDLSNTAITDLSLRTLRKHPSLKELIILHTHASADWVRDFERATPNCRVVWSPRK